MANEIANYYGVDLAQAQQEREEYEREKAAQKSGDQLMLPAGEHVVRICPPRKDAPKRWPFQTVYVHYMKNPHDPQAKGRPVLCELKTSGKPCACCAYVSSLRRSGRKVDDDLAREMRSNMSIYANAILMSDQDAGVKILRVPNPVYENLLPVLAPSPASGIEPFDFTDPDRGSNILIKRVGTGKTDTKYPSVQVARPCPIARREWLDQLHDLATECVSALDDEGIRAILSGKADAERSDGYTPPARR